MLKSLLALMAGFLLTVGGHSAPPSQNINVRDYGALGDGKADDTAAIQKAFAAAEAAGRVVPRDANTPVLTTQPTVFFPSGIYRITSEIKISGIGTWVMGEGWAVIRQDDPEKDILVTKNAWRMRIEGLSFKGGRNQVSLWNDNIDTGLVEINSCNFMGANGVSLLADFVSTNLLVERCRFIGGYQGAILRRMDMVAFRDCWFYSRRDMREKAFIENYSQHSLFENICGVPLVNGFGDRWIDNYATNLIIKNFRFGGEYGGMTPVINYTKPRSSGIPTSVVVENSWACSSGSEFRSTVVYLHEIPNRLELRGNSVVAQSLVQLRPEIDLNTYFKEHRVPASMLSFIAEGNVGELIDQELPELLRKPVASSSAKYQDVESSRKMQLVAAAVGDWEKKKRKDDISQPLVSKNGHRQVLEAERYIDLRPSTHRWITSDQMDSTKVPSDYFLSVAESAGDILWVWNQKGGGWPHIRITDVEVDLDKTPWLTWRALKAGSGAPEHFVVKIRVPDRQAVVHLDDTLHKRFEYIAHDLRKLGLSGKQKLELKIYPAGWDFPDLPEGTPGRTDPDNFVHPAEGSYGVLDFIRFEPDQGYTE